MDQKLKQIVTEAAKKAVANTGLTKPVLAKVAKETAKTLKEALIALPKSFVLKTSKLSAKTKAAHERLYHGYVSNFNRASAELDSASRQDVVKFRDLKLNETYNLNSVKLHELYFGNISDLQSQIHRDSLPYMRLSRDWGTFDNWQMDFVASCEAAREGWGVVYYDPFKDRYLHAVIDSHSQNIPLCGIPILVLDMWSHAYFEDFLENKGAYINAMMREINWQIVEARMVIAERANLKDLYLVRPLVDNAPQKMVDLASNVPPIGKDQITPGGIEAVPAPGSEMQVNPVGNQQNKV